MKRIYLLLAVTLTILSCTSDDSLIFDLDAELRETIAQSPHVDGIESLIQPRSDDFDNIPQDPNNTLTKEKVELGKLLFHETALGKNAKKDESINTYSCASCHHAAAGFQAGTAQGIGDGGIGFGIRGEGRRISSLYKPEEIDVQPVRSPSALNTAYQEITLWNGQFGATGMNQGTEAQWTEGTPKAVNKLGYQGVETQAIAGLTVHRLLVNEEFINENGEYKKYFDEAFSEFPESDRYTNETAGLAIAAYERTILANESPFQNWLNNESNGLTTTELRGAIVFFGDGKCAKCHNGPALNSMSFHALGMSDLSADKAQIHGLNESVIKGRGGFTKDPNDDYKFKTPQLYSLIDSPHYGHGASFNSIEAIIKYKNAGKRQNPNVPVESLSSTFKPLGLTDQEIFDLTQFIRTGLHDTYLRRYVPSSVLSGKCFPNNDDRSRADMKCNS